MPLPPRKRDDYLYSKLKNLKPGSGLCTYGILTEVLKVNDLRPNGKLHTIVLLTDESLQSGDDFRMHLFIDEEYPEQHLIPGNIFRFHRVKVERFEELFDGRIFHSRDVVMFPRVENVRHEHHTSAKSPSFTDNDWKRVKDLREMKLVESIFESGNTDEDGDETQKEINRENPAKDTEKEENVRKSIKETEIQEEKSVRQPITVIEDNYPGSPSTNNAAKPELNYVSLVLNPLAVKRQMLPNPFSLSTKRMKLQGSTDNSVIRNGFSEEELSSAFSLTQRNEVSRKTVNLTQTEDGLGSSAAVCPGIACAGQNCRSKPILLEDDDPRLIDADECSLETEGLGDIPAAEADGTAIYRSRECLPPGDSKTAIRVRAGFLNNFKWTRHNIKIKIVKTKPNLKELQTSYGRKNLIVGACPTCGSYTKYSRIVWVLAEQSKTKTAFCKTCFENGVKSNVCLEFRMKLTATDSWGSSHEFYVMTENACTFFGCSVNEYILDDSCRREIVTLLSKTISSQLFFNARFFRASTPIRIMSLICETVLRDAINHVP